MKKLLAIGLFMGLAGCVTYDSQTQVQQYTDNTFVIKAKDMFAFDGDSSKDFILLKAAESTIDNGHKYFVVMNSEDKTRRSSFAMPSTANTTTTSTATANIYGNSIYANGDSNTTTTYTPGQTINTAIPAWEVKIETYAENEKPDGKHYDALQLVKYLGSKYNPDRWGKENK